MNDKSIRRRETALRVLTEGAVQAPDPKIMRIVALVDSMSERGSADVLIQPLRQRLARLRPPRPLRFERLMFHPLGLLIVPAGRWRPNRHAIPRSVIGPLAEHVRRRIGSAATTIEQALTGRTTEDADVIAEQGRALWPEAARILTEAETPCGWEQTGLGAPAYRVLANQIGALLAEAVIIDKLAAQAAAGLLQPQAAVLTATLARVGATNPAALPMLIAVLLDRIPEAAEVLPDLQKQSGLGAQATADDAIDLLLRQLAREGGTESRIATGSVADAGATAGRLVNLLQNLQNAGGNRRRREQVRMARQRLDAGCTARFASSVQEELLAPLTASGSLPPDVSALETSARGLRVLETEARSIGSGSTYDLLLSRLANAIKDQAMQDRLSRVDQSRLVEILVGADAALAMLNNQA